MELDINDTDILVEKGDKELKKITIFSNKYENALKYYNKAVISYQLMKEWNKCAIALIKSNECIKNIELNDYHDITKNYIDISNCYKNIKDYKLTIEYLEKANELYLINGEFDKVLRYYNQIALINEEEMNWMNAIEYYKKIINLEEVKLTNNNNNYNLTKANQKLGEMYVKLENYLGAIEIFGLLLEYYKKESLKSNILFDIKSENIILTIILCYMCNDDQVLTKRCLRTVDLGRSPGLWPSSGAVAPETASAVICGEFTVNNNINFTKSKHYKFVIKIFGAIENNDIDLYNKTIETELPYSIDHIQKELLIKIKDLIEKNNHYNNNLEDDNDNDMC